jgi:hypothetical protein
MRRVPAALGLALLPDVALACASCLGSAWGDRTYNWAFLGLLLMPFVVAGGLGGVIVLLLRRRRGARPTLAAEEKL